MDLSAAGNIIAVSAYFFLTCLLFWVACIPKANRSTLWWAMATGCALLARLSFLVLKPYLSPTYIEATYAVLLSLEKTFLLIGFYFFFSLTNPNRFKKILFTLFFIEVLLIGITKILFNANTLFAIQFSVLNAAALGAIVYIIARNIEEHAQIWMRPLMIVLAVFCIHWLTYPIARNYPSWLQYGLLFGNLINLVTYLSYAMLALMAFQNRLLQAEQQALQNAEAATQSSKAKSEFLANMSHEIRTPMNGVLGMLELLKKTSLNADQQHKVSVALNSGKSLLTLINDILDFSKIEAGKVTIEPHVFDASQLLTDVYEIMRPQATAKGLSIALDSTQLNESIVIGDAPRVRQIITNLLGNAIKFTERGSVKIQARTRNTNDAIVFECDITDTGIGISPAQAENLFSAFGQADASTTRKYGGTGLGLTISQKLCLLMDGQLSFKSELGKGSLFHFTLTFDKPTAQQVAQAIPPKILNNAQTPEQEQKQEKEKEKEKEKEQNTPNKLTSQQHRILLVEDNEINQLVAEGMLEDNGYTCEMADDGKAALNILTQTGTHYELILMDCQMPIMDGYACTQAIRAGKAGEHYSQIPIIAMTANAMKGDREKCLNAGMDDYITKPLDEDVFITTLHKWLPPVN